MKHRYIFCGVVWKDPCLSSYRLIHGLTYSGGHFIRVNIPDDIEIENSGNGWSYTYDERSIHELGCDCYFLYNGKWRKFNWLKNLEPRQWFRALYYIFGLMDCHDTIGWTDDAEYYKKWWREKRIPEFPGGGRKYPSFKEDKKGLKLKVKLSDNIEIFRKAAGEDEWVTFYDKFKKELGENPDKEIWCE